MSYNIDHNSKCLQFEAESVQVTLTVKDLTQPDAVHVPVYGGQFYIIFGLFCGCFFVAGMVLLFAAWITVTWNLHATSGQDAPWWAFSLDRGW